MCTLCDLGQPQKHDDQGKPEDHSGSRRDFLKTTAAGAAAAGAGLFGARPAAAHDDDDRGGPPEDHGRPGRRYVIRGGSVITMDPSMPNKGEWVKADVLVEGKKIVAVGPNLHAGGAGEIDARGR